MDSGEFLAKMAGILDNFLGLLIFDFLTWLIFLKAVGLIFSVSGLMIGLRSVLFFGFWLGFYCQNPTLLVGFVLLKMRADPSVASGFYIGLREFWPKLKAKLAYRPMAY